MHVVLVSLGIGVMASGVRALSSILRAQGHETTLLFMGHNTPALLDQNHDYDYAFTADEVRQFTAALGDAPLVGISLMAATSRLAYQLAAAAQAAGREVILGGIHPTICPEECLQHAPWLCVGEGEESFPEFVAARAAGRDASGIAGIWARGADGSPVRTPVRPLVADLDRYPLPDYDPARHQILYRGRLIPMAEYYARYYDGKISVHSIRGCFFTCNYCCNRFFTGMFPDWKQFRRKSVRYVIRELQEARRHIPNVRKVFFSDDDFLIRDAAEIAEFAAAYAAQIALPFWILVSPPRVDAEKLGRLIDAGLESVGMGIQSGSEWTNREVFGRAVSAARTRAGAEQLHAILAGRVARYSRQPVDTYYDIITANIFERSTHVRESIDFVLSLPVPFRLNTGCLVLFPGTLLFNRAREQGLISGYDDAAVFLNFGSFRRHWRVKHRRLDDAYLSVILFCLDGAVTAARAGLFPRPLLARLLAPSVADRVRCSPLLTALFIHAVLALRWWQRSHRALLKVPLFYLLGEARYYRLTDWLRTRRA